MSTFDPTNPSSFDPSQLAELDDPYPVFDALRGAGPALLTSSGLCVVTGYDTADETLRDKRFRTGPIAERFHQMLPPGAAQDELAHRINFLDAPNHSRVRSLIQRAFTPARVLGMRPWVESKAEDLLDAIEARARETGEESFDIRADLEIGRASCRERVLLGV